MRATAAVLCVVVAAAILAARWLGELAAATEAAEAAR